MMPDRIPDQKPQRRPRLLPRKPPFAGPLLPDWPEKILPAADSRGRPFPAFRHTDMPVEIVLPRLKAVSGTGPNWVARCPAHADGHPSLSITEVDDGTILIYCHAGCGADAIMAEIGLDLSFLYPSRYATQSRNRERCAASDVCDAELSGEFYEPDIDFGHYTTLHQSYSAKPAVVRRLADKLGLPTRSLVVLDVGYDAEQNRWVIPERDWQQRIVGLTYREEDGGRKCEPGSRRGLVIPRDFERFNGAIHLTEGATDTAALHSVGMAAIGRPNAKASRLTRLWLVKFLRSYAGRQIIVVGDRDPEKNNRRAGQDGAAELARYLSVAMGKRAFWMLPAPSYKDMREQIVDGEWEQGLCTGEEEA